MGFYIKKGFNLGPVRVNLGSSSKYGAESKNYKKVS